MVGAMAWRSRESAVKAGTLRPASPSIATREVSAVMLASHGVIPVALSKAPA